MMCLKFPKCLKKKGFKCNILLYDLFTERVPLQSYEGENSLKNGKLLRRWTNSSRDKNRTPSVFVSSNFYKLYNNSVRLLMMNKL